MQGKELYPKPLILEYNFTDDQTAEIVKFDHQRMTSFTNKWFQAKDPEKAKKLNQKLKNNELSKQITSNSQLLTLLCLVIEEIAEFPRNRSHLYKQGLEILLKKWDVKHNIERDGIYKKLSLQRKEDLLSYIAWKTFQEGDYFFKQKELEQYIIDYIRNLPNAQTDLEELQLDSKAVLKSIEMQHGLLVELGKGFYCFSDLTFHEYFTAREIINSPDPQTLEKALQDLVGHVTEVRWREVFLLAVGMLRNADYLICLMKHQIDALVASDKKIQNFLAGINQKSTSGKTPYEPTALRAISIEFVLNLDFDFARNIDDDLAYDLDVNSFCVDTYTCELQNFQFGEFQLEILKHYYDANKLLADCLNNAYYVTRSVREKLEETLLFPSKISQGN